MDGTEVKSCSRVDQVDNCKTCGSRIMRNQKRCPNCGSDEIKRNNDSKWLIAIRSPKELDMYLNQIPRMLFILSDYPYFKQGDFDTIRFVAYEIWNQSDRAANFRKLLEDYYWNIYCEHIKRDPNKTPAPKNFWPYKQQFYMCNPIKTFECVIHDANMPSAKIDLLHYVEPDADRSNLPSEDMPQALLNKSERDILRTNGIDLRKTYAIDEATRKLLVLRDTSKAMPHEKKYHRM